MSRRLIAAEKRYLLLLLYIPVYLAGFFLIELAVPETADYWVSYCGLDDLIPFNEWFIIPYCLWYPMLFATGFWLMLRDVRGFKLYMYSIIIGFTAGELFCLFFPNGQNLRPSVFPEENLLTDLVRLIYAADTNTNVLPSIHAVGAILAAVAVCRNGSVKLWVKVMTALLAALICISTCFVKQHSVLDVFAAALLCVIVYFLVYAVIDRRLPGKDYG